MSPCYDHHYGAHRTLWKIHVFGVYDWHGHPHNIVIVCCWLLYKIVASFPLPICVYRAL